MSGVGGKNENSITGGGGGGVNNPIVLGALGKYTLNTGDNKNMLFTYVPERTLYWTSVNQCLIVESDLNIFIFFVMNINSS